MPEKPIPSGGVEHQPVQSPRLSAVEGESPVGTPTPRYVERQRLIAKLDDVGNPALTLVCGPAGCGKTSLLESWAATRPDEQHVSWLNVRKEHNHPSRFWAAVIEQLRRSVRGRTARRLGRLSTSTARSGELVLGVTSALADSSKPICLVLDDFELLEDPRTLEQLSSVTNQMPDSLRIVIASRTEPDLHFQRMLLDGRATKVTAGELAFSAEEMTSLLETMDIRLDRSELKILLERTEGWAGAIRLAGRAMLRSEDRSVFLQEFAGTDRELTDYFVEEVYGPLEDHLKCFLLHTCVVDRFDGDFAFYLTDDQDAAENLLKLSRSGVFMVDVDGHGRSFRYERLFSEFLRAELHRADRTLARSLHRKAAEWLGLRRSYEGAIEHALKAEDPVLAARLLASGSFLEVLSPTGAEFDDHLRKLPSSTVRDPEFDMIRAARYLASGEIDLAQNMIEEAVAVAGNLRGTAGKRLRSMIAICRSIQARMLGDGDALADAFGSFDDVYDSAVALEVAKDSELRALKDNLSGYISLWRGRINEAEVLTHRGLAAARWAEDSYMELCSLSQLAVIAGARGKPIEAYERGRQALASAAGKGWTREPAAAGAYLSLAWASYQWDEMDEVRAWLDEAAQARTGYPAGLDIEVGLGLLRAWLARARGRSDVALATLSEVVDRIGAIASPSYLSLWLSFGRADMLLSSGDIAGAAELIEDIPALSIEQAAIAASVRLAQDDAHGALQEIERVFDPTAPDHLAHQVLAWCVRARALDRMGDGLEAARNLDRALLLAEPQRLRRVFLDQDDHLRGLLSQRANRATADPFIRNLVERMSTNGSGNRPTFVLIEPLTEKEMSVLRYLPSLLSTREIAVEFYVSVNTAKTHLKSIYRKLGVNTRRAAVDRGHELGLL